MREFFDWFNAADQPWLVLGKGPTSDRIGEFLVDSPHRIFACNDAAAIAPCEICHVIDMEVIERVGDEIYEHAEKLVMPWHPHSGSNVNRHILTEWFDKYPVLEEFDQQERLLWYNCSTWKKQPRHEGRIVKVRYSCGEGSIRLLAEAGVRAIATLGMDGGRQYGSQFKHLEPCTNGRSFDDQFRAIKETQDEFGILIAAA